MGPPSCTESYNDLEEENLKVNQDSYENGLSNVSDLLEAQALRQQAHDRLTDAMAQYRVKTVYYVQVTGR